MNRRNIYPIILCSLIVIYIAYFSLLSVLRFKHLYSEYFDVGIMHQTVYNTYQAIRTGDFSRVLELTTPHGGIQQIKRMAIHNDVILALLAPFYFIHSGPETILIIQTVVLAIGAWAVYKISEMLLKNKLLSVSLAFAYLMYSPMQHANIFEFHAVTFATTFILFMYYFWIQKKLRFVFLFLVLALLTKEEVGLSLGMFGIYAGICELTKLFHKKKGPFTLKSLIFPIAVTVVSWGWSMASVYLIIPYFNGGEHFATGYYSNIRNTYLQSIFSYDTFKYLFFLMGPIGFFTLIGAEFIFVASSEFGINLLSSNLQLRSLMFQYTSVIQPWLFIGAIYGVARLLRWNLRTYTSYIAGFIIGMSLLFSYLQGPLPYSPEKNIDALLYDHKGEYEIVSKWSKILSSDSIKVSATDQSAPFFAGRRYFYIFSHDYKYADYVVVSPANIQYTYRKDVTIPAYEKLKKDTNFEKVDAKDGYEVYAKKAKLNLFQLKK